MPSNPEKEKYLARKFIDKVLMKELPNLDNGIPFKELIRQTIVQFAVPPLSITKFIHEYYEDLGYIRIEDNIIFKGDTE